jgi:hypothetical protein
MFFSSSSFILRGGMETPVSPAFAGSLKSFRPARPSRPSRPSAVISTGCNLAHPAGIQTRQHQIAAQARINDFNTKVDQPIIDAVNFLHDKCVMCWMNSKSGWERHASDDCGNRIGTHKGDQDFVSFRKSAIRLEPGWCFSCLIHQVFFFLFFMVYFLNKIYSETNDPSLRTPQRL